MLTHSLTITQTDMKNQLYSKQYNSLYDMQHILCIKLCSISSIYQQSRSINYLSENYNFCPKTIGKHDPFNIQRALIKSHSGLKIMIKSNAYNII